MLGRCQHWAGGVLKTGDLRDGDLRGILATVTYNWHVLLGISAEGIPNSTNGTCGQFYGLLCHELPKLVRTKKPSACGR